MGNAGLKNVLARLRETFLEQECAGLTDAQKSQRVRRESQPNATRGPASGSGSLAYKGIAPGLPLPYLRPHTGSSALSVRSVADDHEMAVSCLSVCWTS